MKVCSRLTTAALLACAGMMSACGSGGAKAARSAHLDDAVAASAGKIAGTPRKDLPAADAQTEDLRKYIDQLDPIVGMSAETAFDAAAHTDASALEDAVAKLGLPTPTTAAPIAARQVMDEPARIIDPPDAAALPPTPPVALSADPDNASEATDLQGPPAPPAPEELESPRARLARQLAEIHQTLAALREDADGAAALELLALDLLKGDLDATAGNAELDAVKQQLPPGQRRAFTVLHELLQQVRHGGADADHAAALDARGLSRLLSEHAEKLSDARPLRISTTALCTSVESYGVYTKFASNTFLQGRAQPVIVYVGLENFGQRPVGSPSHPETTLLGAAFNPPDEKEREKKKAWDEANAATKAKTPPNDGWGEKTATPDVVVQLTQSIAIHNDADDLVVWKAPEASIRDVSRERRQDYYLVQRVSLPSRLTLGKYNIKITVRDVATGATDEATIPIEVVADPALVRAR